MYSTNDDYIAAIKQSSRTIDARLIINNLVVSSSDIEKFEINSSIGSSDMPTIGNANMSKLTATVIISSNTPAQFANKIIPEIDVLVGGAYKTLPVGIYTIDKTSIKKTDLTVSFDAYDGMYGLDELIYNSSENTSTRSVITVLNSLYGIQINSISTYPILVIKKALQGLTVRQVLQEIALLYGANAFFDRFGKLVFLKKTSTDFSIDTSNYVSYTKSSDDLSKISKLQTTLEDKTVLSVGDDTGSTLEISTDNITSQSELNNLYTRAGFPIIYQAYELTTQGYPHLDPGDVIAITDKKNITQNINIVSHTLTFNGGLTSKFKCEPTPATKKSAKTSILANLANLKGKVDGITNDVGTIKENIAHTVEEIGSILEDMGLLQDEVKTATGDVEQALITVEEAKSDVTKAQLEALAAQKAAEKAKQDAEVLKQKADNGEFDGAPGQKGDVGEQGPPGSDGAEGPKGQEGVGVSKVEREYYLSSSDKNQSNGSWSGIVPEWQEQKYYWTREKTTKTNGDIAYSTAVLDNSLNGAYERAASAQVSADGKNKVFYSKNAPTAENGLKINDTWFDTDDGNRIYRWNGAQWVTTKLGSNAIDDLAIKNAHLADATIESAKIANLDVGKLTGEKILGKFIAAEDVKALIAEFGKVTADLMAINDLSAICATFTNAIIQGKITTEELLVTGGAYIQSANFVEDVSGFKLDLKTGKMLGNEFWAKNAQGNMRVNYGNWGPSFQRKIPSGEWQETGRIITVGNRYQGETEYIDGLYIGNGGDGNYICFEAGNESTDDHPQLMLTDGLGWHRKGLHLFGGGNFDVSLETEFGKRHSGRSDLLIWGGMGPGTGCNVPADYNFYTLQAWNGAVNGCNTWLHTTIPKSLIGNTAHDYKTIVSHTGERVVFSLYRVDGSIRFWHQGGNIDVYSITGTD